MAESGRGMSCTSPMTPSRARSARGHLIVDNSRRVNGKLSRTTIRKGQKLLESA